VDFEQVVAVVSQCLGGLGDPWGVLSTEGVRQDPLMGLARGE
jgi:hypothetical protein